MDYYYINVSNFYLIVSLAITIILTIFSFGTLFIFLVIPLVIYLDLKNRKYYYNNEKMIVVTGILNKKQRIVPLYRIVNITAQDNIFNFGKIYIQDKQQTIILQYVNHSKNEMMNLIEKWENAKKQNIRNEVI